MTQCCAREDTARLPTQVAFEGPDVRPIASIFLAPETGTWTVEVRSPLRTFHSATQYRRSRRGLPVPRVVVSFRGAPRRTRAGGHRHLAGGRDRAVRARAVDWAGVRARAGGAAEEPRGNRGAQPRISGSGAARGRRRRASSGVEGCEGGSA